MSGRSILRAATLLWMVAVYVAYWLTHMPRR
jgi:hypothetical protein